MEETKYKKAVVTLLTTFILILGLLGTFNYLVDPFGIYPSPEIPGFNRIKIAASLTHDRLHKAFQIIYQKPKSILFGSSRVKYGFKDVNFQKLIGQNYFNASINAIQMHDIYLYLEHTLRYQPNIENVMVGLDFFSFCKQKLDQTSDIDFLNHPLFLFMNIPKTLFNKEVLRNSFKTINDNIHSKEEESYILKVGEIPYVKDFFNRYYSNYEIDPEALETLKNMVTTCQTRGINLVLFINPTKAIYWELIYQNGKWPIVEELKKEICQIHPIWDFSGFNSVTMETVDLGSPLFHEVSHYRPIVGELIIKKIAHNDQTIPDFGMLLTPETIQASFKQQHTNAQLRMNFSS